MEFLDIKSNHERSIIDLAAIGLNNIVLLGHYSYKQAKKKLKMHQHEDMLEICYLETGMQNYLVGDKNYLLKGGDLLLTPPNIIHGSNNFPEDKGSLFWLIIRIPKKDETILRLSQKESKILINRLLNMENLKFKGIPEMKKLLFSIFDNYNKKNDPLSKLTISNLILNFLLKVIYAGEKTNHKSISSDVEFCLSYIDNNIYQDIFISDLASKIFLSESRLKHKFKEEIGIPPNDYILRKKIDKAKQIFNNNFNISISELSYKLSFSSPSYFSTVFKRYQGISPSEYIQT